MGKMRKIVLSLFVSVLYGLLTLGFVFVLMPRWLLPELVWNILLVGVPAAAVIPMIRAKWYVSPACIFAGIPVQYLFLYYYAEFFAYRMGISLVGLPGFRYIFVAVIWPIFFTLVQFFALCIARKIRKRNKANQGENR